MVHRDIKTLLSLNEFMPDYVIVYYLRSPSIIAIPATIPTVAKRTPVPRNIISDNVNNGVVGS